MSNTFHDDIPLMITRACMINKLSRKELGDLIGYSPATMSRLASGQAIDGMPINKLTILMKLAHCQYIWKREDY